MDKMKMQREKETKLVQRAMGEIKKMRGEIAEKDSLISGNKGQTAKMKELVAKMQADNKKAVENALAKNEQKVREATAKVKAELNQELKSKAADVSRLTEELRVAEAKAAAIDVGTLTDVVSQLKTAEATMRDRVDMLRREIKEDIPKVVNACSFTVDSIMQKYVKECALRRKLFNELQELRGNIRVYCRSRPLIQFEKDAGQQDIVVAVSVHNISVLCNCLQKQ